MTDNNTPVQVGSLTEDELTQFTQIRNTASQMIQQLGSLELRKARLVADLEANEQSAQQLLASARERVGLDENTPWQIRDDGSIFALQASSEEATSEESASEEG
tara:strand:- start:1908 stop:2219 length:312 start_codon:yes stop_codon:yes gene_type:complete